MVIVLDADDDSVDERIAVAESHLVGLNLGKCKPKVIVQNCCIESWLLGNRQVFKRQPQSMQLSQYIKFYSVYKDDPEVMGKPPNVISKAAFHKRYLKLMLAERNIRYSENQPKAVGEAHYLSALYARIADEPTHLQTL